MHSSTRMLLPLLACALVASAAEGQSSTIVIPDGTIGVQFEFVPFSVAPRSVAPRPAPQVTFLGPAEGRLTCPMPVFTGNSNSDSSILETPPPTDAAMIIVEESPATGCRNPLFQPPVTRIFVW